MPWQRLAASWPPFVVGLVALVLLTGLEMAGDVAAKEALVRRAPQLAVAGALIYAAMFWVYLFSLRLANLSTITLAWCVLSVVSAVAVDRLRYGVHQSPMRCAAVVVVLACLAFLAQTGGAPSTESRTGEHVSCSSTAAATSSCDHAASAVGGLDPDVAPDIAPGVGAGRGLAGECGALGCGEGEDRPRLGAGTVRVQAAGPGPIEPSRALRGGLGAGWPDRSSLTPDGQPLGQLATPSRGASARQRKKFLHALSEPTREQHFAHDIHTFRRRWPRRPPSAGGARSRQRAPARILDRSPDRWPDRWPAVNRGASSAMTAGPTAGSRSGQVAAPAGDYAGMAAFYDAIMLAGYYDYAAIADELAGWDAASMLELGVGTGLILERLVARRPELELSGVDLTASMLDQAAERLHAYPHIGLRRQDVVTLNLARLFDVIFSYGGPAYFTRPPQDAGADAAPMMISHIPGQPANEQALERIADHLPAGGMLLLGVQDAHTDYTRPIGGGLVYGQRIEPTGDGFRKHYVLTARDEVVMHQSIQYRTWPFAEALDLLQRCGFEYTPAPPSTGQARKGQLFEGFRRR